MNIIHIEEIKRQAASAAQWEHGPQANPYPEGSHAHTVWLNHYYQALQEIAILVAS